MPIYTYRCNKCNKEVDIELRITKHKSKLPCDCGGTLNTIITTTPSVLFKGSDWADKEVRRKRNEDRAK